MFGLSGLPLFLTFIKAQLTQPLVNLSLSLSVYLECEQPLWEKVSAYRKVVNSRLSRLIAHPRIFRLFMKRKLDPYVL